MNTIFDDIEAQFRGLESSKTEDALIKEDAYVLQADYLSEIERLYMDGGLNRKELAEKIKISPSYLSQVFRGDKPLNFLTLAKIKRALNLRFDLQASFASEKKTDIDFVVTKKANPLSFQIERQSPLKVAHFNKHNIDVYMVAESDKNKIQSIPA